MKKLSNKEQITVSISDFLLNNEISENDSIIETYNKWVLEDGIMIESNELSEWALKTLHDMMGVNKDLLKEAISLQNTKEVN